jgi:hypothetical protein
MHQAEMVATAIGRRSLSPGHQVKLALSIQTSCRWGDSPRAPGGLVAFRQNRPQRVVDHSHSRSQCSPLTSPELGAWRRSYGQLIAFAAERMQGNAK